MTHDRRAGRRTTAFSIEEISERFPAKADLLRELHERFQQRTFLPARTDIDAFLYRYVANPAKVRSRAAAEKPVFETLAAMEHQSLEHICAEARLFGKSQLEVVSDAILKRTG